ncbi:MAG: helix-turn-helix transcriptional regulator [Candidatus Cloacimonetes bacterium]|nr:helix-turn-helix transcriptional regulator [Candidatus Cloacimonadota bacterium]MBL7149097.1 helix-turn-helix transcriptional regulator [Candidatus Cloacimonadota bacterium]
MIWQGKIIKDLIKKRKITLTKLAYELEVTRPTINEWTKGKIPKGIHILALCRYFNLDPNELFSVNRSDLISIPQHRMRNTAKQTEETNKLSHELASEYLSIFRNHKKSQLTQTYRDQNLSEENAKGLAAKLRELIHLENNTPINYRQTFELLHNLGVFTIFRHFPKNIKSYAFNCEISNKRVIFINSTTNILDLIFPILHEVIHLIKENRNHTKEYDDIEENYCDNVASYIQFPESYIELIHASISDIPNDGQKVNIVKQYSSRFGHAGFGIVKRMQEKHPEFNLKISPADSNLRKEFPSIGEIIFESNDPRIFVDTLRKFSPLFVDLILDQLDVLGYRKISELFDIKNPLDAKSVRDELMMLIKQRD